MTNELNSRRSFLRATAAATTLAAAVPLSAAAPAPRPTAAAPVEAEVRRRAAHYLAQSRLVVDYYRIYRSLAYPLPVRSLSTPDMVVPELKEYPWGIWMLWALEERIYSLAWAAEWTRDPKLIALASRDLAALAEFPNFCSYEKPDLPTGHTGRLLAMASREWSWVTPGLQTRLRAACSRLVDELLPRVRVAYGQPHSKAELLVGPQPLRMLHNIPLIGTVGAALAANASHHPAAVELNRNLTLLFESLLDARPGGYTEAVGYDGYVLDFLADWLAILPAPERDRLLAYPRLDDNLEASYRLGAPGALQQVAQLGDVEPRQMPFHYSAQAKLARWKPTSLRAWFLTQWPVEWIRADALGRLRPIAGTLKGTPPAEPDANAHYAAVLRSGWEARDLAVVMSATNSPTGHIPPDNGTLLIGTRGEWLISDPGYEQYMPGLERDFTLGPAAHNAPVINGAAQTRKKPRLLRLSPGTAAIDLSECYAQACQVKRTLWLEGRAAVVVADEIAGNGIESVKYHWHGHPRAAWWNQDGWLLIDLDGTRLWLGSPGLNLSLADVARLPGSRGQLTPAASAASVTAPVWWVFALGDTPPAIRLAADGRGLTLAGRNFAL